MVLQDFEQTKQIFDSQSKNGDVKTAEFISHFEPQQAFELVNGIKADLQQIGDSLKPEVHQKVLLLEKWVQQLQTGYPSHLAVACEQHVKQTRQKLFTVLAQMRQTENVDTLLRTTVTEVRKLLQVDRALIYRFQSEKHGTVIAESMVVGFTPSLGESLSAIAFGCENRQNYEQQQVVVQEDVYEKVKSAYQLQLLKHFQVQASLNLPIVIDGQVWGLLAIQQCSGSRQWQEAEVSLLNQIITELRLNLQTVELLTQRKQEAKQEKVLAQILERIPPSSDASVTLGNITQELRQFLKADRVIVYRLNPDWSGAFIAESVASGWVALMQEQEKDVSLRSKDKLDYERCTVKMLGNLATLDTDTYLRDTQGKDFVKHKAIKRVDDIYTAGFSDCYIKTQEKFQSRAYIITPIFEGEQLWGLLGVYQNSGPRRWQDSEATLLSLVSQRFSTILKQADAAAVLKLKSEQLVAERERIVADAIDRIRQLSDMNIIFKTTPSEVRSLLKAERVVIYRFNPDWSGEYVAESVSSEWKSLMQEQFNNSILRENISECSAKILGGGRISIADTYLQRTKGGQFSTKTNFRVVNDIYQAGFSPCYIEILERLQARAYIITPIVKGGRLWGLLATYQNSGPRDWQEHEIKVLTEISNQLGIALQQTEYLKQLQEQATQIALAAEQERAVVKVIDKIRQTSDIDTIFKTATQEIRKLLSVERLTIYKFRPDYFGDFVVESESGGWPKLVGSGWEDPYLNEHQGGRFRNNEPFVIDDIYNGNLDDCHIEALEVFGVKSCLVVSIMQGEKLWGLLSAFQHTGPRHWEEGETKILMQIASRLGIALQQAEYLKQLQEQATQIAKAAEQERGAAKVIEKIRQTSDIDTIFRTATQEIRKLLGVERLTIYKFRPDYFGDFVVESESGGWPKLVGSAWEDPYLNERQGGRFRNNEPLVVGDIYNANLTDCHIEALEAFGVKSCLVVSIFQGENFGACCQRFNTAKHGIGKMVK
ncbi:MAG: GAF domain-containing protein [Scytonema sp. CRU_2_7]|nr:GAF domain-containing protein [Scytonema sp. CRU_2_7]